MTFAFLTPCILTYIELHYYLCNTKTLCKLLILEIERFEELVLLRILIFLFHVVAILLPTQYLKDHTTLIHNKFPPVLKIVCL